MRKLLKKESDRPSAVPSEQLKWRFPWPTAFRQVMWDDFQNG
jgi:hypothetical protein